MFALAFLMRLLPCFLWLLFMTRVTVAEPKALIKLKDQKQKLSLEAVKIFKESKGHFQTALKNKKLNSVQRLNIKKLEKDFHSATKLVEQLQ